MSRLSSFWLPCIHLSSKAIEKPKEGLMDSLLLTYIQGEKRKLRLYIGLWHLKGN